jgi:hypothetical protein
MRCFRRRRREGLSLVKIEISWRDVDLLVLHGYLKDHEADDPDRLGDALLSAARQRLEGA